MWTIQGNNKNGTWKKKKWYILLGMSASLSFWYSLYDNPIEFSYMKSIIKKYPFVHLEHPLHFYLHIYSLLLFSPTFLSEHSCCLSTWHFPKVQSMIWSNTVGAVNFLISLCYIHLLSQSSCANVEFISSSVLLRRKCCCPFFSQLFQGSHTSHLSDGPSTNLRFILPSFHLFLLFLVSRRQAFSFISPLSDLHSTAYSKLSPVAAWKRMKE